MNNDEIIMRLKMELCRRLKAIGFSEGAVRTELDYVLSNEYKPATGKSTYIDVKSIDNNIV